MANFSTFQSVNFDEPEKYVNMNPMNLEPRLMEYINKKNFYKSNQIVPSVPLEKTYEITQGDKQMIANMLQEQAKSPNPNINSNKAKAKAQPQYKTGYTTNNNSFKDFIEPNQKTTFPSSKFKPDPRFERLAQKQKRDAEANTQRHNYTLGNHEGFIDVSNPNLDRDVNLDLDLDTRPAKFSSNVIAKSQSRANPNMNMFDNNINHVQTNRYQHSQRPNYLPKSLPNFPPQIQDYKARLHYTDNYVSPDHSESINKIVGKLNTYRQKDFQLANKEGFMDLDNKTYIPNSTCRNTREQQNNYIGVPLLSTPGTGDIEIDNYMRVGEGFGSVQSRRSLGYPSTYEHNFQYISNDMQVPEHTVMDRAGIATRTLNKSTGRAKYTREVY